MLYCAYVFTSYLYSLPINRYLFVHFSIIYSINYCKKKMLFLILNRVQVFQSRYLLTITIIKSSQ
jgi:hypothetical protein